MPTPDAPVESGWWSFVPATVDTLYAVAREDTLVQIHELSANGASSILLNAEEYVPTWNFAANRVEVLKTPQALSVLVSDQTGVHLLRRDTQGIAQFGLANTNFLDLYALALFEGTSGTTVVFARGDEETVVSAVDLDPQLDSGTSPTDLTDLVAAGATTLTVGARPAFVHTAPDSAGGLWLSIESMDSASCVKSGEMGSCGVGASTDLYDCAWSIDVHHLTTASALADAPRATFEGRLRIGAPCGSDLPPELFHESEMFEQRGQRRHHALVVSRGGGSAAVAFQHHDSGDAVRVGHVDATGVVDPVATIGADSIEDPLLVAGSDWSMLCGTTSCWRVEGSTATEIPYVDTGVIASASVWADEGLLVVGRSATDVSVMAASLLECDP